jgi:hypothetical protein
VSECQKPKPAEGKLSAVIGPIDYPDSYRSPTAFITTERTVCRDPAAPNDPSRFEWYCFQCSFRPWVDAAPVSCAETTVVRLNGRVDRVRARAQGGRFVAATALRAGEAAVVSRGGVRDANGERNGAPSAVVSRGKPTARVLQRAGALAARDLPCARAARLPGRFTAVSRDRSRSGADGANGSGDGKDDGATTRRVSAEADAGNRRGDDDGSGGLPFTGLTLGLMVLAAFALLAGGALLRRLGRPAG